MNDTGNKNRAVESECGPFHLSQLRGAQSIVFTKAPYLLSAASVAGSKEAQGPLGKCFDLTNEDDLFGAETWEEAESNMQKEACVLALGKKNGGLSDARNAGLDRATGELIGFVDSDDYIEKNMYEVLEERMRINEADISCCGRYVVQESDGTKMPYFILDREQILSPCQAIGKLLIWDGCDSAAWDKLYKVKLFKGRRYPFGVLHEDLNFTSKLFSESNKIVLRGLLLKYMNRRSELMSAVSMNEAAKKTAQLENAKEARPPGGAPQEEHLPRKIFVCSPYRPTSQDEKCRKDELEANIRRAKMACRILSTLGFLPLAPHLYFTQFLKDEEKQERNTGIQLGMQWLEEADELWVFGSTVSEGMAAEIKRAHELQKKVRNLPEPGRVVELLLKNISEQYHVPLNDKKTEGQQEAAESEEDNGE